MAEPSPQNTASSNIQPATSSQTQTVLDTEDNSAECPPILTLRLQQPDNRSEHKVKWSADTVDNEFMNKKKSKCCCIYEKPKVFGESDTSSEEDDGGDDCTPHCRGHKKKCYRHGKKKHDHPHHDGEDDHDQFSHGGRDDDGAEVL